MKFFLKWKVVSFLKDNNDTIFFLKLTWMYKYNLFIYNECSFSQKLVTNVGKKYLRITFYIYVQIQ